MAMLTWEGKRMRSTSTTRQLPTRSTSSQEWTVPSLTRGRNQFHFDGSCGDRPCCFLVAASSNHDAETNNHNQEGQTTLLFHCHWYDQGWGDQQGRVLVVEQERPKKDLDKQLLSLPFGKGRLVAMSPIVQHDKRHLTLRFPPKPNKLYQFWCIVGGGGYNELHLEEVILQKYTPWDHKASIVSVPKIFLTAKKWSSLSVAPLDVKRKIVSFLSHSDAIHLISSCKRFAAELALSQVVSLLLGDGEHQAWTNSPHPNCFAVYLPKTVNQVHSILFQCTISIPDYSWWCLGPVTISIIAQGIPKPNDTSAAMHPRQIQQLPFEQGRLISKRSIVFGNCKTAITLTFLPKKNECYQVWLSRDSSFVPPTAGLTIVENPRFRTIGYGTGIAQSFTATYTGFPPTQKTLTGSDFELLSNGMGQTVHQLMRLQDLQEHHHQHSR
ncbi:unnamed protein product [Cylindrotheca closterium]|uniref:Uncharacterized protein n=1 Tax=Cylindrotheca closterium TaxID=2856 RepID=A0AAD2FEY2_9STRA|nr:unnamed protein product [Cylindrotheca closterium]